MANTAGKSYGMTVLHPMRPVATLRLAVRLIAIGLIQAAMRLTDRWALLRHSPLPGVLRAGLANRERLEKLSFIHFARWVLVLRGQWPRPPGSTTAPESVAHDYLFFESNFNGTWEQYMQAFSRVVPGGMDKLWRWSEKYPTTRPLTPFLGFLRWAQIETDYYYNAYPGATKNDVSNAVLVDEALERLELVAATATGAELRQAYERFLREVQGHLGRTGPDPARAGVVAPPGRPVAHELAAAGT